MTTYAYIWEFTVHPEHAAAFARAYGPEGDWVKLFRQSDGYLRTELHRDADNPLRFITVDYWKNRQAHDIFKAAFAADYVRLDKQFERYTQDERFIGHFHLSI
jgi:quinol monooxygenase YgiN